MKKTKPDLNQPISKNVRRARRAAGPAARAADDIESVVAAYLEAGHLSPSDLEGEISLLRSVLRRVFALATIESKELEERGLSFWDEAAAGEKMPRGAGKQKGQAENWRQASLFPSKNKEEPEEDPGRENLELWVQTLESLSKGAMRLANLMRAHQALNKDEAKPETNDGQAMEAIQQRVSKINSDLQQDQNKE